MPERRSSLVPAAVGGLVLLAAIVWFALSGRQPPQPPPTLPPATLPAATPEPAPTAEPTPAPTPAPTRKPARAKPQPSATPPPDIARMVREAEAAFNAGRYDDAAALFEQAAKLDPKNSEAGANAVSVRRRFVISGTYAESTKGGTGGARGFDQVAQVKRAAEVPASLEIVVSPSRVRVRDKYQMEIYLINEGKKTVKIKSVNAVHKDAGRSIGGVLPLVVAEEVASRQRELVAAIKETLGSEQAWSLEITVHGQNGDLYRASVSWK